MLFLLALLAIVVYVNAADCHKCTPGNFTGTLLGASYEIKVPANFNGVLVLYARDYSDTVPTAEAFFGGDAYEAPLLNAGYALAGSNYGAAGWAVREGLLTTTALRLVYMKVAPRCWPKKVILYGQGMGSVVALSMAEKLPKCLPLSAVVAGCALGAGTTRTWDSIMDFNNALKAINGGFPFGAAPNAITPGLTFLTDVRPKIQNMVQTSSWFTRLEFQRLLMGYPNVSNAYYIGANPGIYTDYFYSTQAMLELQSRAGGVFASNLYTTYALSNAARSYLVLDLGMPETQFNGYTVQLNLNEYAANATARAYLAKYADFNGQLNVPVITVHGMYDDVVHVSAEAAYKATVTAAGKQANLFQAYTTGLGHCNFTPDQLYVSIVSAVNWATTGTAPTAADFSASLGFNMSFVPPNWNNFGRNYTNVIN